MRATGKKSTKPANGCVLIASLKVKKDYKKSVQKHKQKSKSNPEKVSSILAKRTVDGPPKKGLGKDLTSTKLISRKILQKALDKKSSRKWDSSSKQIPANKNDTIQKPSKRKSKRRKKERVQVDQPARLQGRARYLMVKMKQEQNLIDAYSGEGWKGQSREKIKPEEELQRAKNQILKFKLGIRDVIHQLDKLSTVGCIEDSVMAPDGSVSHEHIFCAKCKSNEVFPDNDIVLCDGTCNCAFHQKCLEPPLDTENIPPGDQGWFCKFCECRMEIIEAMNAHLGTHFSVNCNSQDIFKEEAAFPDGGSTLLNPEDAWPSDDSEDDDYDPEKRRNSIAGPGTDEDESDGASSSTSLICSSDSEVFLGSRMREMEGIDFIDGNLDSDESSDREIISGRRQRTAVDYKKLYDEMFGKDAPGHEQVSEDEDWGPRKRKRREKESDAASTLITLYESEKKVKTAESIEAKRKCPQNSQVSLRRPVFRMPPDVVKRLRQIFAENELPSRAVRESLSVELGLDLGKVNKWFKNARYLALKSRKTERVKHFDNSGPEASVKPRLDSVKSTLANGSISACDRNSDMILLSKNSKSRDCSISEPKSASFGSPAKTNEMNIDYSDDVSLKRLLKAKSKRVKKRMNSISAEVSQVAEDEMERLHRAKVRLEKMKQVLLPRVPKGKARKSSNRMHLQENSVILVPIAELKEKS